MLEKCQGYSFYLSDLLRENQIKEPLLPSNKSNDKTEKHILKNIF